MRIKWLNVKIVVFWTDWGWGWKDPNWLELGPFVLITDYWEK